VNKQLWELEESLVIVLNGFHFEQCDCYSSGWN